MGVDTNIRLPVNVRARNVADVIGILSGKKVVKVSMDKSFYAKVEGVSAKGSDIAGLAEIVIDCPVSDAAQKARLEGNKNATPYCLFNYESHFNGKACFLMIPSSTPYWIAIGKGLIDFFGGSMDYNDCDDKDVNYKKREKSRKENSPENDKPWEDFQNRLWNLKPLTEKDFDAAYKHAVYNEGYVTGLIRKQPTNRITALEVNA